MMHESKFHCAISNINRIDCGHVDFLRPPRCAGNRTAILNITIAVIGRCPETRIFITFTGDAVSSAKTNRTQNKCHLYIYLYMNLTYAVF